MISPLQWGKLLRKNSHDNTEKINELVETANSTTQDVASITTQLETLQGDVTQLQTRMEVVRSTNASVTHANPNIINQADYPAWSFEINGVKFSLYCNASGLHLYNATTQTSVWNISKD